MDFATMNTTPNTTSRYHTCKPRSSSYLTHQKIGQKNIGRSQRKERGRKTICTEGTVRYGIENWVTFTTMGSSAASKHNKLQRQPPVIPERPTVRNTQSRTVCNDDWVNSCQNCGRQFSILLGYNIMCASCRL